VSARECATARPARGDGPCSGPPGYDVVLRHPDGREAGRTPSCLLHGLAEVERARLAGGIVVAELVTDPDAPLQAVLLPGRVYGLCGCTFEVERGGTWRLVEGCELHGDEFECPATSIALVADEPDGSCSWSCSGRCGRYGTAYRNRAECMNAHARTHPGTL
jgi:hypothetical protein